MIRDDQPDAREGQAGRIDAGTSPCTSKHPTAMTSQIMRSRRYVISIAAPGCGNGKVCAESSICNRRFISSMRAGYRSRIASLLTACHPRRSWSGGPSRAPDGGYAHVIAVRQFLQRSAPRVALAGLFLRCGVRIGLRSNLTPFGPGAVHCVRPLIPSYDAGAHCVPLTTMSTRWLPKLPHTSRACRWRTCSAAP